MLFTVESKMIFRMVWFVFLVLAVFFGGSCHKKDSAGITAFLRIGSGPHEPDSLLYIAEQRDFSPPMASR